MVFPIDTGRALIEIPILAGTTLLETLDTSWSTGGTITVTEVTDPNTVNGGYHINQDGSIVYTAPLDVSIRQDSVQLRICDGNNICKEIIVVYIIELPIAPVIIDPCNCLANESAPGAKDGQFSEYIKITSFENESWWIVNSNGFYKKSAGVFPPASGGVRYPQTAYQTGDKLTEIATALGRSEYALQGIHVDGIGYTILVTNGRDTLTIGQKCNYDASCRFSVTTSPDGTPGEPIKDTCAQNLIIGTNSIKQIDSLLCCDDKTTFVDDGALDGLYKDDTTRNEVFTICPQNQWQILTFNFKDFSLAIGDTLYVYDGLDTMQTLLLKATGEGISRTGGWVSSSCDPKINASGCLTFNFKTNGDLSKGRGWSGNFSCEDRGIIVKAPNDLNYKFTCAQPFETITLPFATIEAACGIIQDSQLVSVYNANGRLCLDTCAAVTEVLQTTFGLGNYRVEYKLKSDTVKSVQAILAVQAPSLVCNDEVTIPLGSTCSVTISPDDLLENPCDTITDTMYYYITIRGIGKDGKEQVLAEGGGKGGNYPLIMKEMIAQCGNSISATIERRYYEGRDLTFCNNGVQSQECTTKVNIKDQSAPIFLETKIDTFITCNVDLTQTGLGLPTPEVFDNCSETTVEFVSATELEQGTAPCDTVHIEVVWKATDECGNTTDWTQKVVIIRPSLENIVKTGKVIIACDSDISLDEVIQIPGIQTGKLENGILEVIDTLRLSTEEYIGGYILQKRDVETPANDCGKKVYRYWSILDGGESNNATLPIDTTFIEFKDTLAPQFIAGTGANSILELDHAACTYDITNITKPSATDNCSVPTVRMDAVFRIENGQLWGVATKDLTKLASDSFQIRWIAEDACQEQLINDTIIQIVEIKDVTKPSVICTDKILLSLGQDATSLHYSAIDNGSSDACGIEKYEISRDEEHWDSIVTFTCEDVHDAVQVYLRVTDKKGNQNTCWMTVVPEDKIAPNCTNLSDVKASCDDFHNGALGINTDSNENGKLDDTWVDLTEEQMVFYNEKFGQPNCSDNLTCEALTIQQQYQLVEKSCGIVHIKRRYRAIDWFEAGNISDWATQNINLDYKANWTITLPADWQGTCGDSIPKSTVTIVNGQCDLMGYEVEEKTFTTVEDACLKVVRTFTMINWCKYEAGGETIAIARDENEQGMVAQANIITSKGYENVGKLTYTQVLKLTDETVPVISVGEVDNCLEGEACGATKQFAITATDCNTASTLALIYNWTISANDKQLASGEGATFDYPVAPKVKYVVSWTVADNCGNTAWKDATYEFWDCKKPSPYCLNGIVVELMSDVGMTQVWASDIESRSVDNCTSKDKLAYRIWHANFGEAPTDLEDVLALPEVVTMTCNEIGTQTMILYVIDEEGNWDFCVTYVIVQDNTGACQNIEVPIDMATISGTIMDWKERTVEKVRINAIAATATTDFMTKEDGQYNFELERNKNYTIEPQKDVQPLNGVSTFDLVLISKHILGITPLENPYQQIAADVNNSGTITAFDMVQLRQLILNIKTAFQNNTSWRFVEAAYEFTSNNPLAEDFPEMAQIDNLSGAMLADFVAIKIGDVNGNAVANSLVQADDRTTAKIFEISTIDKELKAGETYMFTFSTKQIKEIQGYQFTLAYNDLQIEKLTSGIAKVENFGLHKMDDGYITTSWNQKAESSNTLSTHHPHVSDLFTIEFTALQNGRLSEQLAILNRPTVIEAYDENGAVMDIQLTFTNSRYQESFELFQNQPNPFYDKTMIGFYLPGDSEVQLILRDEKGRILKTFKEDRKAGYNTIQLDKEALTNGFIYYQLSTKYGTQAKKMLKLK